MTTIEKGKQCMSLAEQGRHREAIACCDKIISSSNPQDPQLFHIYNIKGVCHHALGEYDKAINSFDLGIANYPNYPMLWVNKGKTLQKVGRNVEAQECFEKVKKTPFAHFLNK